MCTLDSNFTTNPNTSSLYNVDAADVHVSLSDADQAQGFVATYTDTTTITLDSAAVATANYYVGSLIIFTHGTGAGQSREITGYTSGRVVTMSPVLAAVLDTTTVWHIQAAVSVPEIATEVWDATIDEATAGATPTTAKGKFQGIWNRLFTKKTVTASAEKAYEKDDSTEMEAWTLADDDTTASRTR